jgi:hypothetical protein
LSEEVFKVDQVILGKVPTGDDQCRFNATVLENVVKGLVQEKLGDADASMAETGSSEYKPCPTFVVATSAANADGPPVLFRTYRCEGFNANVCAIWQAARCTSAAPSFFRRMFVGVPAPGGWYLDGGLRHNNPSQVALDEARRIWPTVNRFCLVSIGTGRQKFVEFIDIKDSDAPKPEQKKASFLSRVPGASILRKAKNTPAGLIELKKIGKACVEMSTSSEPIHQFIFGQANSRDSDVRFPYYRFNVERGMDSIDLEEWKARVRIGELTAQYMREGEGELKTNACVHDLSKPAQVERK